MSYLRDFINLIYPNTCLTCGKSLPGKELYVCPRCWMDMPKTNFHKEPGNKVEQIFWGRFPIENGTSFFYYTKGSSYQKLIHEMKYNNKKEIGYILGKKFGRELENSAFKQTDYLVPVPLHKKKLRKRGFNQSERIARGISDALGIPVSEDNLYRSEYTKSQTKKSRHERWKNVENVFTLRNRDTFENKRLLLIDDILTTGATLEACANALLESKGAVVSIATLGFADN